LFEIAERFFPRAFKQSISRYLIENALREEAMTFDEKEHAEAIVFQRDWAINEVAKSGKQPQSDSATTKLATREHHIRRDPNGSY
jgi:hypothetical protein